MLPLLVNAPVVGVPALTRICSWSWLLPAWPLKFQTTAMCTHVPAAKLCAGAVSELQDNDCPAVPGAQALYFGADQPRIVAEAMLPWAALGLDGPPHANKLSIEVSATSWDNGRWMSLSGLAPRDSSASLKRWLTVSLGAGDRAGGE